MFTDRPLTGGPSLNAKVKLATAELSLAYFDLIFEGDGAALLQWQATWQSILAQAPRSHFAPGIGIASAPTRPGPSSPQAAATALGAY
jgi:hypothetical protein